MTQIEKEQLKDFLRSCGNCSLSYAATEYWINKYWDHKEDLAEIKKLGNCDHEVLEKL